MGRTIKTLEDAARYRMLVAAKCRDCGKTGKFMATDLAGMYGRHKRPKELPFKCDACGTKNCDVTLEEWGDERVHETIVWRPTKVRVPK